MKKFMLVLLVVMMTFVLGACSSESSNVNKEELRDGMRKASFVGFIPKEGSDNEVTVMVRYQDSLKFLTADENTTITTDSFYLYGEYSTSVYFDDDGYVVLIDSGFTS